MDISDAVTTDYVAFDPDTRVAKLMGTFRSNPKLKVVFVTDDDGFAGVVSRKQLLSSHHPPEERANSVLRSAPQLSRTEDVRETARLMVESELKSLPVFEGSNLVGEVSSWSLLDLVQSNLDALDVDDVATHDLVTVPPDATFGQVINTLRTHDISRVPVVDDDRDAVGVATIYDMVEFTVRETDQEQGGSGPSFDGHGGEGSGGPGYRTHGGYGERAGEQSRLLDLPVRDVMTTPTRTVEPDESLRDAVARMLEDGFSSLVVVDGDGDDEPIGIVTDTDVLRSLTWTEDRRMTVQIFGVDLLDDLSRDKVAAIVEDVVAKHGGLDVLETNVVLHEHKETTRGRPLLQATIRLFTDDGRLSATGEGYGAGPAIREAAEILERNVLDNKSKRLAVEKRKRPIENPEDAERLLGWWLEA
jgi:CBS domain-containing protein